MRLFLVTFALVALCQGSEVPNMNPSMSYTLSNPAKGYEGVTQKFASSNFFEVDSPTMAMKVTVAQLMRPSSHNHNPIKCVFQPSSYFWLIFCSLSSVF